MDPTRRRQFLVRSIALALLASARVEAQPRTYRMAILTPSAETAGAHLRSALIGRLEELGYREGRNLAIERRFAEGRLERLPSLTAELVALKPDIMFTIGTTATLAAIKATSTIPIVFVLLSDPVGSGVVKSLRRPGANATGLSTQVVEIQGKRLQLLKDAFPSVSRVAVLHNPLNAPESLMLSALKKAGTALALNLRVVEVGSPDELASAFKTLESERPDALYIIEGPLAFSHRNLVVEFANSRRLIAVYGANEFAVAGGLMSLSENWTEHYRAAATYVDKILKGAKPADLPVQQPTRFELVLNLKTAKAQGVKFPPSIVLRADRVIE
jgi:putative ABC transport system substrate-binding protein